VDFEQCCSTGEEHYPSVGLLGTGQTTGVPYYKVKPVNSRERRKERRVAPQRRLRVQVACLQTHFAVGIFGKPSRIQEDPHCRRCSLRGSDVRSPVYTTIEIYAFGQ